MIDEWRRGGREVSVAGLGRSGTAAARLLRRAGIPVYASDAGSGPELEASAAALRKEGAEVETGRHDLARIARSAALILSPGIPPDAPPAAAAREAGVPVRSEVDLGFEQLQATRCIGLTGTNGKTTTTALTAHLLAGAGWRATAAGNIGTPVCEAALADPPYDWLAVEVSSFQLHDSLIFAPAVGVLTNLAPDHLDRYPDLQAYYADKSRLFLHATADSVWVTNADDPGVQAMAANVAGRHRRFSVRRPADGWYDRDRRVLILDGTDLLPRRDLALLGDHNVANALAAALAAAAAGAGREAIARALGSFQALPHRLEPVGEVDGVLWINDSKATNVASTEVAVAALERPFVLLLGGRHKGEPYTRLAAAMGGRCRAIVAYGEAGDLVERDLRDLVPVHRAGSFADVVALARRLAHPGDAVLLSPACSSYDMFRNYEDRGAQFRAAAGGS